MIAGLFSFARRGMRDVLALAKIGLAGLLFLPDLRRASNAAPILRAMLGAASAAGFLL